MSCHQPVQIAVGDLLARDRRLAGRVGLPEMVQGQGRGTALAIEERGTIAAITISIFCDPAFPPLIAAAARAAHRLHSPLPRQQALRPYIQPPRCCQDRCIRNA